MKASEEVIDKIKIYADIEILVDKRINVEEGHKIATQVHDQIEKEIEESTR